MVNNNLSLEEELAMCWMAGCIMVIMSIVLTIMHFIGTVWVLLTAICGTIVGFHNIFKAVIGIKRFAKRGN